MNSNKNAKSLMISKYSGLKGFSSSSKLQKKTWGQIGERELRSYWCERTWKKTGVRNLEYAEVSELVRNSGSNNIA